MLALYNFCVFTYFSLQLFYHCYVTIQPLAAI